MYAASRLFGVNTALTMPVIGLPLSVATGTSILMAPFLAGTSNSQPTAITVTPIFLSSPSSAASPGRVDRLNLSAVAPPRLTTSMSAAPLPPAVGRCREKSAHELHAAGGVFRRLVEIDDHGVARILRIDSEVKSAHHLLIAGTDVGSRGDVHLGDFGARGDGATSPSRVRAKGRGRRAVFIKGILAAIGEPGAIIWRFVFHMENVGMMTTLPAR